MGDVIEFRSHAAGTRPRRPSSDLNGECRILLFTGVRYERHADTDGPVTQPTDGTKPRVGNRRRKKRA